MRLVVVVGLVLAALALASSASAATYTNSCPDMPPDLVSATDAAIEMREEGQRTVQACLAEAERLEAVVSLLEAQNDDAATPVSTRVALAPDDRDRLDLTWWGMWALVGLTFALLVAPMMQAAFRWWQE